mmetsp:Transcript_50438/g.57114  ORF Transcript_50438/g.57114 Transcript_50438/m.57114 type:complete len:278 (-) Transcript_50438:233-1066(-)
MSNFVNQVLSAVPASHSVTYSCTFTNTWSSENHPFNYPGSAHWSPPVIAAHGNKYTMWKPGEMASNGVKIVAETGSPGTLKVEVDDAMQENKAGDVINGGVQFNRDTQEQMLPDIALTPWFDMMSSITMVAPSPDWYTGFYNVKPVDPSSMVWYESFEIPTYPWDAGTDEGDDFNSSNQAQDPRVPILQLTKNTVPENGVLLNPEKTEVLPMATWSCSLKGSSSCNNYDNVMKGKTNKNCNWVDKNKKKKREKRCQKKYKGLPLSEWCPKACRVCEA